MNKRIAIFVLISLSIYILCSCQQKIEVRKTHESLHAVLWKQKSAEFKALSIQAYKLAEMQLQEALIDENWTAALEQMGDYKNLPSAIIVDVDETVLDNSPYEAELIQNGEFYSSKSWNTWCNKALANAVPGALEFCQNAKGKGVTVFYVTNRRNDILDVTRTNLRQLGFPLEKNVETILPRLESSDKGTRRELISANYRILLLIGDNLGDFASGFTNATMSNRDSLLIEYKNYFGKKWISLANPIYGDWEGAIFDYNYGLSDKEKLELKINSLISK